MLPTVNFFGHEITRVIVGDNPAHGNTYIHDLISSEEMSEYYTEDNIVKMLKRAKETGYNAGLMLASPLMFSALRRFNAEEGGMKFMFQTYPPMLERFAEGVEQIMEFDPIAVYHQGSTAESMIERGEVETFLNNVEIIRKTGVPTGMAFHNPENVLRAERENWGADFYTLCPYNSRRNRKGQQSSFITGASKSDLVFHPDDRHVMFPIIRDIQKPVVVIKALAGGQIYIGKSKEEYPAITEQYLAETFENIKPSDVICIGVFQRDVDQLKQNADIVSRILGSNR